MSEIDRHKKVTDRLFKVFLAVSLCILGGIACVIFSQESHASKIPPKKFPVEKHAATEDDGTDEDIDNEPQMPLKLECRGYDCQPTLVVPDKLSSPPAELQEKDTLRVPLEDEEEPRVIPMMRDSSGTWHEDPIDPDIRQIYEQMRDMDARVKAREQERDNQKALMDLEESGDQK